MAKKAKAQRKKKKKAQSDMGLTAALFERKFLPHIFGKKKEEKKKN